MIAEESVKAIRFDGSNKDNFPWGTIYLLFILYLIGFFTLEYSKLYNLNWRNIAGHNILNQDMRDTWTLKPELVWQWQVFTFHLMHFAVVHFAYIGVLLFYYGPGLERATNKRFLFLAFYLGGVIGAILNGILFIFLVNLYPSFNDWILSQDEFLGSSIGVWALIGFSVPISYKRLFYWFGIGLLLVLEFFLKIIRSADITANIVHVLVFLVCWAIGSRFIDYGDTGGKVGELRLANQEDRLFILLIAIHSIGLFLFFFDQLNLI